MTGPPSSSGLGFRPFKAATRVRIPLGAHNRIAHAPVEESGRPHRPVKAEIAGSKPVGRADLPGVSRRGGRPQTRLPPLLPTLPEGDAAGLPDYHSPAMRTLPGPCLPSVDGETYPEQPNSPTLRVRRRGPLGASRRRGPTPRGQGLGRRWRSRWPPHQRRLGVVDAGCLRLTSPPECHVRRIVVVDYLLTTVDISVLAEVRQPDPHVLAGDHDVDAPAVVHEPIPNRCGLGDEQLELRAGAFDPPSPLSPLEGRVLAYEQVVLVVGQRPRR